MLPRGKEVIQQWNLSINAWPPVAVQTPAVRFSFNNLSAIFEQKQRKRKRNLNRSLKDRKISMRLYRYYHASSLAITLRHGLLKQSYFTTRFVKTGEEIKHAPICRMYQAKHFRWSETSNISFYWQKGFYHWLRYALLETSFPAHFGRWRLKQNLQWIACTGDNF